MSNDYRKRRLSRVIREWVNYFKLVDMKQMMLGLDAWTRCTRSLF